MQGDSSSPARWINAPAISSSTKLSACKHESYRRANMSAAHGFQSSSRADQERMHRMGANSRVIPSSSLKDGQLFQGIHIGIH
jgi:hypothetical protein